MKKIAISLFTLFSMVAVVAGGTAAVFTDTDTVAGNTVSAGTVDIKVVNTNPLVPSGLAPGEWTHYGSASSDWHRANVQNEGTLNVDIYKHIEITNNEYCDQYIIQTRSRVGNDWNPRNYKHTIAELAALGPIKISHKPLTTESGWGPGQLREFTRVQLSTEAPNDAQGSTCTWNTIYTAQSVIAE